MLVTALINTLLVDPTALMSEPILVLLSMCNGAKHASNYETVHGTPTTIQLPTGQQFTSYTGKGITIRTNGN